MKIKAALSALQLGKNLFSQNTAYVNSEKGFKKALEDPSKKTIIVVSTIKLPLRSQVEGDGDNKYDCSGRDLVLCEDAFDFQCDGLDGRPNYRDPNFESAVINIEGGSISRLNAPEAIWPVFKNYVPGMRPMYDLGGDRPSKRVDINHSLIHNGENDPSLFPRPSVYCAKGYGDVKWWEQHAEVGNSGVNGKKHDISWWKPLFQEIHASTSKLIDVDNEPVLAAMNSLPGRWGGRSENAWGIASPTGRHSRYDRSGALLVRRAIRMCYIPHEKRISPCQIIHGPRFSMIGLEPDTEAGNPAILWLNPQENPTHYMFPFITSVGGNRYSGGATGEDGNDAFGKLFHYLHFRARDLGSKTACLYTSYHFASRGSDMFMCHFEGGRRGQLIIGHGSDSASFRSISLHNDRGYYNGTDPGVPTFGIMLQSAGQSIKDLIFEKVEFTSTDVCVWGTGKYINNDTDPFVVDKDWDCSSVTFNSLNIEGAQMLFYLDAPGDVEFRNVYALKNSDGGEESRPHPIGNSRENVFYLERSVLGYIASAKYQYPFEKSVRVQGSIRGGSQSALSGRVSGWGSIIYRDQKGAFNIFSLHDQRVYQGGRSALPSIVDGSKDGYLQLDRYMGTPQEGGCMMFYRFDSLGNGIPLNNLPRAKDSDGNIVWQGRPNMPFLWMANGTSKGGLIKTDVGGEVLSGSHLDWDNWEEAPRRGGLKGRAVVGPYLPYDNRSALTNIEFDFHKAFSRGPAPAGCEPQATDRYFPAIWYGNTNPISGVKMALVDKRGGYDGLRTNATFATQWTTEYDLPMGTPVQIEDCVGPAGPGQDLPLGLEKDRVYFITRDPEGGKYYLRYSRDPDSKRVIFGAGGLTDYEMSSSDDDRYHSWGKRKRFKRGENRKHSVDGTNWYLYICLHDHDSRDGLFEPGKGKHWGSYWRRGSYVMSFGGSSDEDTVHGAWVPDSLYKEGKVYKHKPDGAGCWSLYYCKKTHNSDGGQYEPEIHSKWRECWERGNKDGATALANGPYLVLKSPDPAIFDLDDPINALRDIIRVLEYKGIIEPRTFSWPYGVDQKPIPGYNYSSEIE